MIDYEVNLTINENIFAEYYGWLIDHIKEILQFPGFLHAVIGEVQTEQNVTHKMLRVCYTLLSESHLNDYLSLHAPKMRAEAVNRFGDKFSATRRVIVELATLKN